MAVPNVVGLDAGGGNEERDNGRGSGGRNGQYGGERHGALSGSVIKENPAAGTRAGRSRSPKWTGALRMARFWSVSSQTSGREFPQKKETHKN